MIARLVRRRRRDDGGYIAAVGAILIAFVLMGLAAIGVDTARWWLEEARLQKVADAAAMAGVTHMPADFADAEASARDLAKRNMNDIERGRSVVSVERAIQPSQLRVTVQSRIPNVFGSFFGVDDIVLTRTALADYTAPQPMGSPCNVLADEPPGSPGAGPVASQLSVPSGASCPRYPQFWMSVAGPEVYKTQGDQYGTRYCVGTENNCTAGRNDDFRADGYYLAVRVGQGAVNQPVTIQLYDPAYVSTGAKCDTAPTPTNLTHNTDNWNPWATTDARTRYAPTLNTFCSGDSDNSGRRRGSETPTVTSYGLRAPTEDANPLSGAPVQGCARQYPGYGKPTIYNLRSNQSGYSANLSQVFHAWTTLCTFVPPAAGEYYLQVRTNVPLQGSVNSNGSYLAPTSANARMFTQTGDNTSVVGNGTNSFGVRAYGGSAGSVSIGALGRMPIYANADAADTTFNLIRVTPSAAGKTLVFSFFDIGDATGGSGSATMTVLRPTEATGTQISNCTGTGHRDVSLPACSIGGISNANGWDGKIQNISVPIPADYNCNFASQGGCWFRVNVKFPTGVPVTDVTTWTAYVAGDPVRLVE